MLNSQQKKILEILACPICKGKLAYRKERNDFVCKFDKVSFPIEDDAFVLLEKKAKKL
ncbi:MAG: Trm112 family protein [Gammaproteobacteria bacterium]|nr:Trm112 family protein [Gammaproteobacteria bacterium]